MFYLFEYNLYTILSFYCILRAEYAACFLRKPGAIANGKERGAPQENAQLYYVRLEDLTAAARYWFESDDAFRKSTVWTGLSCEEAAWEIVNNADVIFYDNGIVLSPDLLSPVWTWDCTAAVLLAAFDLTGLFLLRRTHRA